MALTDRDIDSPERVSLKVKLGEIFGENLRDDPAARLAFGQAIIDRIVNQAEEGKGVRGNLRGTYSDAYADSVEFKAFGKSQGDVNMTLTGSMLSSMNILSHDRDEIVIGWDAGSLDGKKAHGHITGQNGANPRMKRDFFGLTDNKVREEAESFQSDFTPEEDRDQEARLTVADLLAAVQSARGGLFG